MLIALAAICVAVGVAFAVVAGGRPSPPPDRAARFVPGNAMAYVHLASAGDNQQRRLSAAALAKLPSFQAIRDNFLAAASFNGRIDFARAVRPWLGGEAAVAVLPPTGAPPPAIGRGSGSGSVSAARTAAGIRPPTELLVLSAGDVAGARRFIAGINGTPSGYGGTRLVVSNGLSFALKDGFVLVGPEAALTAALDSHAGTRRSLARERRYEQLVSQLPPRRVLHAYGNAAGLSQYASGVEGLVRALTGGPALSAAAVSFGIEDGHGRLALRASAPGVPKTADPCERPHGAKPKTLSKVPKDAAAFFEVPNGSCLVRAIQRNPRSSAARAIARLTAVSRKAKGPDPYGQLAPLLSRGAAVMVTPSRVGPALTLVAAGVNGPRALDLMNALQPALVALVGSTQLGTAPSFGAQAVKGAEALTADLAPNLQLSYAAFGDRLAVSTALGGIAAARARGGLTGREDYKAVIGNAPAKPSALLFLDLDRLLALADQVGLSGDAGLMAVRDDLQKLGALGASVERGDKHTNAEIRFNTP